MGSGVAAMHYIGMAAIRSSAVIVYDVRIVVLSVALAIAISFVALKLAFLLRDERTISWRKIISALVMGSAIPLMHYAGMRAATFHPSGVAPNLKLAIGISAIGVLAISASAFFVLAAAIASSYFDRFIDLQKFALHTSRERGLYFQTIAEAVPEIIWTATPDGQDDYFNQRCFDYTGLTLKEMEGAQWKVIVHPDDLEGCFSKWQNALRVGELTKLSIAFEVRMGLTAGFWDEPIPSATPPERSSSGSASVPTLKIRSRTNRYWNSRFRNEPCS
jgi:PAS domain S-box-containing protein